LQTSEITVYALDSKLTGVCLPGLIAVELRAYIAGRRRSVVSILSPRLQVETSRQAQALIRSVQGASLEIGMAETIFVWEPGPCIASHY
jgi:hypothetical protein